MVTLSGTSYTSTQPKHDGSQPSEYDQLSVIPISSDQFKQVIPDPENDDESSVFAREKSPTRLGHKDTFGESVKTSVLKLANEFRENSTLLIGLRGSNIPDGKIALLVIEAVATRSKSLASTKSILRHVNGLLQFYLDTRSEMSVTLTGESSLVLIHDYLESLTDEAELSQPPGNTRSQSGPKRWGLIGPLQTLWSYPLQRWIPTRNQNRHMPWI